MTDKTDFVPLWQLSDSEREMRLFLPWRRLCARILDLFFYMLIWWGGAYLILHRNILLLHWLPCSAAMLALSLAFMLVLEPLLISVFRTTPGKALFGICVGRKDGGKLSVAQSYLRTFRVMTDGCGFVVIPVYNLLRMYKAYKACQVEGRTDWDGENTFEANGRPGVRMSLGVLFLVFCAAFFTVTYFAADMPVQRGDLTPAQLEENLDGYWQFHDTAWNTELFYTINLQYYETSVGYIFDRMDPPEVIVEETNGIVTGVSFEFTDESRTVLMALPVWLRAYAVSFVGAQDGMSFVKMHAPGGVLDTLLTPVERVTVNREGSGSASFTAAGVDIHFEITAGSGVSAAFKMSVAE